MGQLLLLLLTITATPSGKYLLPGFVPPPPLLFVATAV